MLLFHKYFELIVEHSGLYGTKLFKQQHVCRSCRAWARRRAQSSRGHRGAATSFVRRLSRAAWSSSLRPHRLRRQRDQQDPQGRRQPLPPRFAWTQLR